MLTHYGIEFDEEHVWDGPFGHQATSDGCLMIAMVMTRGIDG